VGEVRTYLIELEVEEKSQIQGGKKD